MSTPQQRLPNSTIPSSMNAAGAAPTASAAGMMPLNVKIPSMREAEPLAISMTPPRRPTAAGGAGVGNALGPIMAKQGTSGGVAMNNSPSTLLLSSSSPSPALGAHLQPLQLNNGSVSSPPRGLGASPSSSLAARLEAAGVPDQSHSTHPTQQQRGASGPAMMTKGTNLAGGASNFSAMFNPTGVSAIGGIDTSSGANAAINSNGGVDSKDAAMMLATLVATDKQRAKAVEVYQDQVLQFLATEVSSAIADLYLVQAEVDVHYFQISRVLDKGERTRKAAIAAGMAAAAARKPQQNAGLAAAASSAVDGSTPSSSGENKNNNNTAQQQSLPSDTALQDATDVSNEAFKALLKFKAKGITELKAAIRLILQSTTPQFLENNGTQAIRSILTTHIAEANQMADGSYQYRQRSVAHAQYHSAADSMNNSISNNNGSRGGGGGDTDKSQSTSAKHTIAKANHYNPYQFGFKTQTHLNKILANVLNPKVRVGATSHLLNSNKENPLLFMDVGGSATTAVATAAAAHAFSYANGATNNNAAADPAVEGFGSNANRPFSSPSYSRQAFGEGGVMPITAAASGLERLAGGDPQNMQPLAGGQTSWFEETSQEANTNSKSTPLVVSELTPITLIQLQKLLLQKLNELIRIAHVAASLGIVGKSNLPDYLKPMLFGLGAVPSGFEQHTQTTSSSSVVGKVPLALGGTLSSIQQQPLGLHRAVSNRGLKSVGGAGGKVATNHPTTPTNAAAGTAASITAATNNNTTMTSDPPAVCRPLVMTPSAALTQPLLVPYPFTPLAVDATLEGTDSAAQKQQKRSPPPPSPSTAASTSSPSKVNSKVRETAKKAVPTIGIDATAVIRRCIFPTRDVMGLASTTAVDPSAEPLPDTTVPLASSVADAVMVYHSPIPTPKQPDALFADDEILLAAAAAGVVLPSAVLEQHQRKQAAHAAAMIGGGTSSSALLLQHRKSTTTTADSQHSPAHLKASASLVTLAGESISNNVALASSTNNGVLVAAANQAYSEVARLKARLRSAGATGRAASASSLASNSRRSISVGGGGSLSQQQSSSSLVKAPSSVALQLPTVTEYDRRTATTAAGRPPKQQRSVVEATQQNSIGVNETLSASAMAAEDPEELSLIPMQNGVEKKVGSSTMQHEDVRSCDAIADEINSEGEEEHEDDYHGDANEHDSAESSQDEKEKEILARAKQRNDLWRKRVIGTVPPSSFLAKSKHAVTGEHSPLLLEMRRQRRAEEGKQHLLTDDDSDEDAFTADGHRIVDPTRRHNHSSSSKAKAGQHKFKITNMPIHAHLSKNPAIDALVSKGVLPPPPPRPAATAATSTVPSAVNLSTTPTRQEKDCHIHNRANIVSPVASSKAMAEAKTAIFGVTTIANAAPSAAGGGGGGGGGVLLAPLEPPKLPLPAVNRFEPPKSAQRSAVEKALAGGTNKLLMRAESPSFSTEGGWFRSKRNQKKAAEQAAAKNAEGHNDDADGGIRIDDGGASDDDEVSEPRSGMRKSTAATSAPPETEDVSWVPQQRPTSGGGEGPTSLANLKNENDEGEDEGLDVLSIDTSRSRASRRVLRAAANNAADAASVNNTNSHALGRIASRKIGATINNNNSQSQLSNNTAAHNNASSQQQQQQHTDNGQQRTVSPTAASAREVYALRARLHEAEMTVASLESDNRRLQQKLEIFHAVKDHLSAANEIGRFVELGSSVAAALFLQGLRRSGQSLRPPQQQLQQLQQNNAATNTTNANSPPRPLALSAPQQTAQATNSQSMSVILRSSSPTPSSVAAASSPTSQPPATMKSSPSSKQLLRSQSPANQQQQHQNGTASSPPLSSSRRRGSLKPGGALGIAGGSFVLLAPPPPPPPPTAPQLVNQFFTAMVGDLTRVCGGEKLALYPSIANGSDGLPFDFSSASQSFRGNNGTSFTSGNGANNNSTTNPLANSVESAANGTAQQQRSDQAEGAPAARASSIFAPAYGITTTSTFSPTGGGASNTANTGGGAQQLGGTTALSFSSSAAGTAAMQSRRSLAAASAGVSPAATPSPQPCATPTTNNAPPTSTAAHLQGILVNTMPKNVQQALGGGGGTATAPFPQPTPTMQYLYPTQILIETLMTECGADTNTLPQQQTATATVGGGAITVPSAVPTVDRVTRILNYSGGAFAGLLSQLPVGWVSAALMSSASAHAKYLKKEERQLAAVGAMTSRNSTSIGVGNAALRAVSVTSASIQGGNGTDGFDGLNDDVSGGNSTRASSRSGGRGGGVQQSQQGGGGFTVTNPTGTAQQEKQQLSHNAVHIPTLPLSALTTTAEERFNLLEKFITFGAHQAPADANSRGNNTNNAFSPFTNADGSSLAVPTTQQQQMSARRASNMSSNSNGSMLINMVTARGTGQPHVVLTSPRQLANANNNTTNSPLSLGDNPTFTMSIEGLDGKPPLTSATATPSRQSVAMGVGSFAPPAVQKTGIINADAILSALQAALAANASKKGKGPHRHRSPSLGGDHNDGSSKAGKKKDEKMLAASPSFADQTETEEERIVKRIILETVAAQPHPLDVLSPRSVRLAKDVKEIMLALGSDASATVAAREAAATAAAATGQMPPPQSPQALTQTQTLSAFTPPALAVTFPSGAIGVGNSPSPAVVKSATKTFVGLSPAQQEARVTEWLTAYNSNPHLRNVVKVQNALIELLLTALLKEPSEMPLMDQ